MDNQQVDVNGNGPRRPSVTMGIEHLLSVCKVKKNLKRKRTYGKKNYNGNLNGNLESPSSKFATLEQELKYSVSTQVNGQDLSNASQEESLEALQSAPEPILIEVLRSHAAANGNKKPTNNNNGNNNNNQPTTTTNTTLGSKMKSTNAVTVATQTDQTEDDYCSLLDLQSAASLAGIYPFLGQPGNLIQPSCRQGVCFSPSLDLGLTDLEMGNDDPIYDEPWDMVRPPIFPPFDIEYEVIVSVPQCLDKRMFGCVFKEVILQRKTPDEKLGLTLCYEAHTGEEEVMMDVYVSEIEPDSVAASNGSIRPGDQILQINSTEVRSREEAIQFFSTECSQFVLLLARQVFQEVDDGFVEDKSSGTYEDLQIIAERQRQDMADFLETRPCDGTEDAVSMDTTSTSKSKQDSGLSRTDDSIKTEESSEQDCIEADCIEKCCHSNDSFTSSETPDNLSPSNQMLDNNHVLPGYPCDTFNDAFALKCNNLHSNNNTGADCHGVVEHKPPPRSPSNKSDSNSCKSMSLSSNSSCHSSPLRQKPEEHIYDEPNLSPSPTNTSPTNTYQREIIELNKEIENMRLECRKISESNKQELERSNNQQPETAVKAEPQKSPRVVPRMGTRLDYIRQLHVIQQYGRMSSWIRQNQWSGTTNSSDKENSLSQSATQTTASSSLPAANPPFFHPYYLANVPAAAIDNHHGPMSPGNKVGTCDTIERELQYSHEKDIYKDTCTSTTSAYNTGGDSCRSTPLTLEVHPQYGDDGGGGYNMSMLSLAITNNEGNTPSDHETRFDEVNDNSRKYGPQYQYPHHAKKKSARHASQTSSSRSKEEGNSSKDSRSSKSKLTKSPSSSSVSHMTQTPEPTRPENLHNLYAQYADVMYTNQANLQHTMMVQQRLFQQQLMQQAKRHKESSTKHSKKTRSSSNSEKSSAAKQGLLQQHELPLPSATKALSKHDKALTLPSNKTHLLNAGYPLGSNNNSKGSSHLSQSHTVASDISQDPSTIVKGGSSGSDNANVQMEWVVKLRPDGTRYIARRPVRSKILKERAKKLTQERSGMTTDDDAMSEMKVGRYWRKEDRKRHMEKAKEYKQKKEQMLKQKLETLKENEDQKQKEPNILDLSHRKMMKHKSKKVLDDFVTVQEMLVHGNRAEVSGKVPNPLLSVTTV